MLRCQCKAQHLQTGMLQFMFQIRLVVCKLLAQMRTDLQFLFCICHWLHTTEYHNTFNVQRPLSVLPVALVIDTVGDLVVFGNGVDLVPCFCPMEIQLTVCFAVPVVHGNAIRISVIAQYRQDASRLVFQNCDAVLIRKLLFPSSHRSKHFYASFFIETFYSTS